MRDRRAATGALLLLTVTLIAALLPGGCRAPRETSAAAKPQTYHLRGRLERLAEPGEEHPTLWIHHEAVPDFRSEQGQVVGMGEMTMPFAVAEGVELGELAPGDAVGFTLSVNWAAAREPAAITRIEKLPAETRLAFEASGP